MATSLNNRELKDAGGRQQSRRCILTNINANIDINTGCPAHHF